MVTFSLWSNLPPDYDKEQTSSLASASLEARWPAEQGLSKCAALPPFIRECISMATFVCAHGTAILTDHGPSELVAERIFMPSRLGYGLYKKMIV